MNITAIEKLCIIENWSVDFIIKYSGTPGKLYGSITYGGSSTNMLNTCEYYYAEDAIEEAYYMVYNLVSMCAGVDL